MNHKMTTTQDLITALHHIVGSAHVLAEGDLSAWETDWRGRSKGRALAVVRPGTTHEVAEVVRLCARPMRSLRWCACALDTNMPWGSAWCRRGAIPAW